MKITSKIIIIATLILSVGIGYASASIQKNTKHIEKTSDTLEINDEAVEFFTVISQTINEEREIISEQYKLAFMMTLLLITCFYWLIAIIKGDEKDGLQVIAFIVLIIAAIFIINNIEKEQLAVYAQLEENTVDMLDIKSKEESFELASNIIRGTMAEIRKPMTQYNILVAKALAVSGVILIIAWAFKNNKNETNNSINGNNIVPNTGTSEHGNISK